MKGRRSTGSQPNLEKNTLFCESPLYCGELLSLLKKGEIRGGGKARKRHFQGGESPAGIFSCAVEKPEESSQSMLLLESNSFETVHFYGRTEKKKNREFRWERDLSKACGAVSFFFI